MKHLTFEQLREVNSKRSEEWGGEDTSTKQGKLVELLFRSNEMGGESGEAQDAAKKLARGLMGMVGGKDISQQSIKDLADELADVIICADRVAELFDINLSEAVASKFNYTSDKYGLETKF